jgi:hypothetical protein
MDYLALIAYVPFLSIDLATTSAIAVAGMACPTYYSFANNNRYTITSLAND